MGRGQVGAVWKLGKHCQFLDQGFGETKGGGGLRRSWALQLIMTSRSMN